MGKAFNLNLILYVDSIHHSDEHPAIYSKNKKTFYSPEHIQKLSKAIEYAKTFENVRVNPENKIMQGFLSRLPKINCIMSINDNIEELLNGYEMMKSGQTSRTVQKRVIDPKNHYFIRLNESGNNIQLENVVEKDERIHKEVLQRFNALSDKLTQGKSFLGQYIANPLPLE